MARLETIAFLAGTEMKEQRQRDYSVPPPLITSRHSSAKSETYPQTSDPADLVSADYGFLNYAPFGFE